MSIFKSTFEPHVRRQLNARRIAAINRTPQNLSYLNSRNAWVRMTSSVDVNGSSNLARTYVLQGGTLNPDGSFKTGAGTSFNNAYSSQGRLGLRPMPGITSVDIKSKSAYGSLREATVNFNCWSINQLEDLELLYMRPGYTVLVEWGWAPYITSNNYHPTFNDFYDIINKPPTVRSKLFADLFAKSKSYEGNYDAMYGYVKNYEWSARIDGGYDCKTVIITTGEIMESLKINYTKPTTVDTDNSFMSNEFNNDARNPNDSWIQAYSENALAGMWAELYYKVEDSTYNKNGINPVWNTVTYSSHKFKDFYISSNTDNEKSLSRQNSNTQVYITLDGVLEFLNRYIIAKSELDNEPMVRLSLKDGYKNDLICTAHPLQVSVDPGICLIKSPKWYDPIGFVSEAISEAQNNSDVSDALDILSEIQDSADAYQDDTSDYIAFNSALSSINGVSNLETLQALRKQLKDKGIKFGNKIKKGDLSEILGELLSSGDGDGFTKALELKDNLENLKGTSPGDIIVQFTGAGSYSKIDQDNYRNVQELWNKRKLLAKYLSAQWISSQTPNVVYYINYGRDLEQDNADNRKALEAYDLDVNRFNALVSSGDLKDFIGVGSITIKVKPSLESSKAASLATLAVSGQDALANFRKLSELSRTFFLQGYNYDDDEGAELAYMKGIYVNVDYLYLKAINAEQQSADDKGKEEINLYNYVKSIMSDIQATIGNVQDFEIHIDPVDNNVARPIDVKYTEYPKAKWLKLYELPVHQLGSMVRSYSLQSQIFPNQSTLVAIGSQAKSNGALGVQANTMIDFNRLLTDRIIPSKGDGTLDKLKEQQTQEELYKLSINNGLSKVIAAFATQDKSTQVDDSSIPSYDTEISAAKTGLRDTIVHVQALTKSPSSNRNIIPTKFSCEIDGIGGMIIGNMFRLPNDVMPRGYRGEGAGSKLGNVVTGISHTIKDGDWTTKIKSQNIVLDE